MSELQRTDIKILQRVWKLVNMVNIFLSVTYCHFTSEQPCNPYKEWDCMSWNIISDIMHTNRTIWLLAKSWQLSRVSLIKVMMSVTRVDYQAIALFSCRWTATEHENYCLLKRPLKRIIPLLKTKETLKRVDSSNLNGLSNEQTLQKYCCRCVDLTIIVLVEDRPQGITDNQLTGCAKLSGLKYPLRKLGGKGLGQIKIVVLSLWMQVFTIFS